MIIIYRRIKAVSLLPHVYNPSYLEAEIRRIAVQS
jgi:hypothetical protein